ncbi:MAG: PAS domain S-box protein [Candidatus Omnitrophota bacterium]|nr:MAG: PAS domain S-box protein [Candidatus Omnitrophota bacterium]
MIRKMKRKSQTKTKGAAANKSKAAKKKTPKNPQQLLKKLREVEKRYRTIADFTYDWVYWQSPKETLFYVSPSCERITGYKQEEFIKRPSLLEEIIIPEDSNSWHIHHLNAKKEFRLREMQFRIRRKDGQIRWIEHACQPVINEQGRFLGFRVSNRDITKRKEAEEKLRISSAHLNRAQEVAHLGSWRLDLTENELIWSDEIYRIFGVPLGLAMTYEKFLGIVHPEDRDYVDKRWSAALNREPYDIEHRIIVDGKVKWVREKAEVEFNEKGKAIRGIGVVQDITERKKAEEALIKEKEKAEDYLRIAGVMFVAINDKGQVILINKKGCEILGYRQQEIIGKSWFDNFLPKRIKDEVKNVFQKICAGEIEYVEYYENPVLTKNGEERIIAWHNAALWDDDGKIFGSLSSGEDVTEHKKAEEYSRRLREELMHVTRVSTMGELTAALAHELNQPLAAILSNAQAAQRFLARQKPDLNEVREILSDIIKDDKRAGEVITKLRSLLKKSELESTILNINEVIGEVIPLIHSDAVIKNISLSTELNDNIPLVSGDRIQLQQVILNLILNGFEAMINVDSKRLCIRTAQEDKAVITISVKDSGCGFDEKNIDILFKPFFTTKKEGMGMGLAINKAIIETHGGRLLAKNNPDKGATFYFTLPVAEKRR